MQKYLVEREIDSEIGEEREAVREDKGKKRGMGGWEDGRGNGRRNKSKCPMRIHIGPPSAV